MGFVFAGNRMGILVIEIEGSCYHQDYHLAYFWWDFVYQNKIKWLIGKLFDSFSPMQAPWLIILQQWKLYLCACATWRSFSLPRAYLCPPPPPDHTFIPFLVWSVQWGKDELWYRMSREWEPNLISWAQVRDTAVEQSKHLFNIIR